MIKSRSGQIPRHASSRTQYCFLKEWSLQEKRQKKNGSSNWTVQDVIRSSRVLWLRWRSYWIRVGNSPEQRCKSDKYDQNVESERFSERIIFMSMFSSTNSVAVVEVQSSISTLRVIRDFDNGFRGNFLEKKKNHGYVKHSQISMLCDLISWKRKGQDVGLLHHKTKSARWTWRRW